MPSKVYSREPGTTRSLGSRPSRCTTISTACPTSAAFNGKVPRPRFLIRRVFGARAHAPELNSTTASVLPMYHESMQVAACPCWKLAAPPALSPRIFPRLPGPLPRRSPWCICSFLPTGHRPSPSPKWVGTPQNSAQRLPYGVGLEAAAIPVMCRPPSCLATPLVPTPGLGGTPHPGQT
jgi:hypothetical protein